MADLKREVVDVPVAEPVSGKWLRLVFVALAPISLVGYLLAHVWLNLTGACYNLVIESSLNPLLERSGYRPVELPSWLVYLLSPLIVLVAPLAGIVHGAIGLGRSLGAGFVRLGRWQAGVSSPAVAGVLGAVWALLMVWMVAACLDPRTGWQLLGRDLPGYSEYRSVRNAHLLMAELPPAMQERRAFLLSGTPEAQQALEQLVWEGADPEILKMLLGRDDVSLTEYRPDLMQYVMPPDVQRYITGLPWYFQLAEESRYGQTNDGQERSAMLIGCLFLAVVLMIRWPGMGFLAAGGVVGIGSYVVRVGAAAAVVIAAFAGEASGVEKSAGWVALLLLGSMAILAVYWLTWKASQYWRLPRQYSPFLAMRLLQRKRIALFSLGAVMLCVAMVVIVVSVMGGFLDMVRDRSHKLLGDIVMEGSGLNGFPYYQEFIDKIEQWPQVEAATPVIYSYGLLRYESGETQPVRVVGLKLDEVDQVNGFKQGLFYDEWYPGSTTLKEQPQYTYDVDAQGRPVLPDPLEKALASSPAWEQLQKDPDKAGQFQRDGKRMVPVFPGPGIYAIQGLLPPEKTDPLLPGMIIGRDIVAERLPSGEYYRSPRRPRGVQVTLTLIPLSRKGVVQAQTGVLNKAFRYADDSRTGVFEIDSQSVYADFDILQDLLQMGKGDKVDGGVIPARASQIQIKVKPGVDLQEFKFELSRAWSEMMLGVEDPTDLDLMSWVRAQTWEEKQWAFISAVEKEKVLMLILFGVISVVAIFLILCIFYMIVVEKTRDIGILKSIGGSAGGVAAVFLSYGAAIGVVGSALGILLGSVFVRYINDIQDWLARLHPELRVWKADVYSFESIPNVVKVEDVVVIGVIAVIASIIGALVPALVAARKHPVESLRYE